MSTCKFEKCYQDAAKGKSGFCHGHFTQLQRGYSLKSIPRTTEERFWAKVERGDPKDCWNWTGSNNGIGHGHIRISGVKIQAHRYSYEMSKGLIPPGFDIDHMCRNSRCVNPDHLQAVPHDVNQENQGPHRNHPTGYRGVVIVNGKYRAQASKLGRKLTKSGIASLEEAVEIVKGFRRELFTNNLEDYND